MDHTKGFCAKELTVFLLSYSDTSLMDLRIDLGDSISDTLLFDCCDLFEELSRLSEVINQILLLSIRVCYLSFNRGEVNLIASLAYTWQYGF